MKKILGRLLILVLLGVGFWIWTILFPPPKLAIRNDLNRIAHLVSSAAKEGNLSRGLAAEKINRYLSDDLQVALDVPNFETHTFNGRGEVMQTLMAVKTSGGAFKVEFLDPQIELGVGNESALVELTLKGSFEGQNDIIVQELKFTMKKLKGDWLITRVETVKTLKP